MEILLGITIILVLGGLYQIQKKLDFLEQRINEVEDSLTEEIQNYGTDKSPLETPEDVTNFVEKIKQANTNNLAD